MVAEMLLCTECPIALVVVAVKVIVPSFNALTSMLVNCQVPSAATTALWLAVVCVPSVPVTTTVDPTSPVPLTVTAVAFERLIGFVTNVTDTVGSTVTLGAVRLAWRYCPNRPWR